MDGLVRGVGCVTLAASSLEWALGYLTHAMRLWDDAKLNDALAKPGYLWHEFDRLVTEMRPLLGDDVTALRDEVKKLREERNRLVHSVWMRADAVPGVSAGYETWHPRTDTTQPVTADDLMELADQLGQAVIEVQALTTALLDQFSSPEATESPTG
jgi:hypothetical protein